MNYVFVDLETSGLDPELCDILEVGIVVYDKNFNKLAVFNEVAHFYDPRRKDSTWIDPFVIDMHTKNGLWDECHSSGNSLKAVEQAAVEFLKESGWDKQPMAGSTISFDRAFLKKHMPKLEATFHYRNIDVSTLKILWNMYGLEPLKANVPVGTHRAISDCDDSAMSLLAMLTELEFPLNVATPKL